MSTDAIHGAPVAPGADRVERLLADLNPAQREAVTHGDGPLLVLAGAGSGKTRVLTYRIAWLLATGRAQPSEVLAITFTNKAAGEMRERVAALVGGVSRAMWVMTFHSACARILRAEAPRLGYKRRSRSTTRPTRCGWSSAACRSSSSTRSAIRRARSAPRSRAPRTSSPMPPTTARPPVASSRRRSPTSTTLYERRMVEASAMDFDDLLVRTVNLLELFADVRDKYRRIFRWVLVDEYQDTNRAQYRLLQLLAEEHRNLTVVGDEDQCIYGFRGADIRNILDFDRDFPDATTVVKLEQNYRSTQTILDAANALIANNTRAGEAPVDRPGPRRADHRRRARRRARRGALRRLRDQPTGRGGNAARPDRGLLPHERAEPGARGHARPLRDSRTR